MRVSHEDIKHVLYALRMRRVGFLYMEPRSCHANEEQVLDVCRELEAVTDSCPIIAGSVQALTKIKMLNGLSLLNGADDAAYAGALCGYPVYETSFEYLHKCNCLNGLLYVIPTDEGFRDVARRAAFLQDLKEVCDEYRNES